MIFSTSFIYLAISARLCDYKKINLIKFLLRVLFQFREIILSFFFKFIELETSRVKDEMRTTFERKFFKLFCAASLSHDYAYILSAYILSAATVNISHDSRSSALHTRCHFSHGSYYFDEISCTDSEYFRTTTSIAICCCRKKYYIWSPTKMKMIHWSMERCNNYKCKLDKGDMYAFRHT